MSISVNILVNVLIIMGSRLKVVVRIIKVIIDMMIVNCWWLKFERWFLESMIKGVFCFVFICFRLVM